MKEFLLQTTLIDWLAPWTFAVVTASMAIIYLIIRFLKKNKTRFVLLPVVASAILLNSCSQDNKVEDPTPLGTKQSHDDIDGGTLPEVTVYGTPGVTYYQYIDDATGYVPYYGGGVGGSGGGAGSPGGTNPSNPGSGGISNEEIPDPESLKTITLMHAPLNATQTLQVQMDVRHGEINNVTAYASGLTAGTKFTQQMWAPINQGGNVYTAQVIWYVSINMFLAGFGDVAAGTPLRSTIRWDANNNTSIITTRAANQ